MSKDERLFFIGATFGKYMELYGSKNNYALDEDHFNNLVFPATKGELTDRFKQAPLTDDEIGHCIYYIYIYTVADRLFEVDKKEMERFR